MFSSALAHDVRYLCLQDNKQHNKLQTMILTIRDELATQGLVHASRALWTLLTRFPHQEGGLWKQQTARCNRGWTSNTNKPEVRKQGLSTEMSS